MVGDYTEHRFGADRLGVVTHVEHPLFGTVLRHAPPVAFSGVPGRVAPSPLLGEHTDPVLAELGYSNDNTAELRENASGTRRNRCPERGAVMGTLEGKVAIITGSANGIGAATAYRLAQEGAAVVIADIDTDGAAARAETIASKGGTAIGVGVDIADESSVQRLIATTVSTFGGIDVLHNNASAMNLTPADVDVLGLDLETWDGTMQTNLRRDHAVLQGGHPAHPRARRRLHREHLVGPGSPG